jgi:GDP-4-dehydro-6-deoxy-D-mannose reductase
VLEVGGLDAARDFTDVHDVVRAYRLAADGCYPGQVYNICSGRHYTIREILERLLELTEASIEVRHDPTRMRKSEIPLFYGDSSRLRSATGWQPEYDIDSTLRDTLDYWRQCIRSSSPGAGPHPQG